MTRSGYGESTERVRSRSEEMHIFTRVILGFFTTFAEEKICVEMHLVIDKGNTATKLAVFDKGEMLCMERVQVLTIPILQEIQQRYAITRVALSTVSGIGEEVMGYLNSLPKFLNFTASTPTPIENPFPTLGADRLAAVVGAYSLHQDANFVVIDLGTCITYEVVLGGKYVGGNILPGVALRLKSLHEHTYLLPEVEPRIFTELYGTDTDTAILAGVMGGVKNEIEGFISSMRQKYGDFSIFLTGGDAKYFENQIKFRNFAIESLVPLGLNYALTYNE